MATNIEEMNGHDRKPQSLLSRTWRSFAREPMVQFAAIAVAFFVLHGVMSKEKDKITITPAVVDALVDEREALLGRSVSAEERELLIAQHVDGEILFREALARGLDHRDGKIRQRLISKMQFLMEDEAPEPTEDELLEFYASHAEFYRTMPSVSFVHVFFENEPNASEILARLQAGEDPATIGDQFWMGARLDGITDAEMKTIFGVEFTSEILDSAPGVWHGPLRSGRGIHFVRVTSHQPSQPLPYDLVRTRLLQDWSQTWMANSLQRQLEELRAVYSIEIQDGVR